MSLLSPYDDLLKNTLGRLRSRPHKLCYLSSLRREDGQYSHWGLARKHGLLPARKAIGEAHREIWLQMLRTPLPELFEEITTDAAGECPELVAELRDFGGRMVPSDTGGGALRHFRAVVLSLSALWQARETTGPVA